MLCFSGNSNDAGTTNRRQLSYDEFQKFQSFRHKKEHERQGHFAVCKRKKKEQVSVS